MAHASVTIIIIRKVTQYSSTCPFRSHGLITDISNSLFFKHNVPPFSFKATLLRASPASPLFPDTYKAPVQTRALEKQEDQCQRARK